jgi:hypothetical protein
MFTGLLTGRRQALKALELSEAACEGLLKLRQVTRELEDRLATLEGQHKTLRGRFYATRPDAEEGAPEPRRPRKAAEEGTRDERRRAALAGLRNGTGAILPPGYQEK